MKHPLHSSRVRERGYSLPEMLVVIAIIGVISLVSVPQFIAFQRGNQLRASMRQVTNDIRLLRQQAITERTQSKLLFATGATEYQLWVMRGGAWSLLRTRPLEKGVTISTPVRLKTETVSGTAYNAIVFRQNGTADLASANDTNGTFRVVSPYTNLAKTSYVIEVHLPGFVKAS